MHTVALCEMCCSCLSGFRGQNLRVFLYFELLLSGNPELSCVVYWPLYAVERSSKITLHVSTRFSSWWTRHDTTPGIYPNMSKNRGPLQVTANMSSSNENHTKNFETGMSQKCLLYIPPISSSLLWNHANLQVEVKSEKCQQIPVRQICYRPMEAAFHESSPAPRQWDGRDVWFSVGFWRVA